MLVTYPVLHLLACLSYCSAAFVKIAALGNAEEFGEDDIACAAGASFSRGGGSFDDEFDDEFA